jgi:hypothetical protein
LECARSPPPAAHSKATTIVPSADRAASAIRSVDRAAL